MAQQRPRHLLRRRADVEEQRGIVRHLPRGQPGDPALFLQAQHLARGIGEVFDAAGRRDAAMEAPQQGPILQQRDVAADGLRRHLEPVGQGLDRDIALLADQIDDLALSRRGVHGRSSSLAGRKEC